ncbi:MAG: Isoprenylcysteine carboxyl methyltransferase (ICMT) family protein [Syntrophorhabdaceae bacterium PtaU1.Bin034]|jgi:protein-S-isoprenylcysteine O-methyltransferase Ste14|nr:MAG: Isoprenylcysteine carboxyl methyltransferase (ICMT) family protein [Syntrophorhabdaceae bacterium PtaU1.Bin034]
MHGLGYAYGFWGLVIFNVGLFLFFILSFLTPKGKGEWRSMGVTTAFFVALFTEMYGFPLTIYILAAIFGHSYPAVNPFSHTSGHLWVTLLGGGAAVLTAIHVVSNGLVAAGFIIMWKGWKRVHGAEGRMVTEGVYTRVRHPQYSGLFLVMVGMLIQWPTIVTALMFPVLLIVYHRLARKEEAKMIEQEGDAYRQYVERTPMFVPRMRRAGLKSGGADSMANIKLYRSEEV